MCLGSLFVPEAYITATRQYVAQANSWSLEELCLEVNVTTTQGATLDACSFGIKGPTKHMPSALLKEKHQNSSALSGGTDLHGLISRDEERCLSVNLTVSDTIVSTSY